MILSRLPPVRPVQTKRSRARSAARGGAGSEAAEKFHGPRRERVIHAPCQHESPWPVCARQGGDRQRRVAVTDFLCLLRFAQHEPLLRLRHRCAPRFRIARMFVARAHFRHAFHARRGFPRRCECFALEQPERSLPNGLGRPNRLRRVSNVRAASERGSRARGWRSVRVDGSERERERRTGIRASFPAFRHERRTASDRVVVVGFKRDDYSGPELASAARAGSATAPAACCARSMTRRPSPFTSR